MWAFRGNSPHGFGRRGTPAPAAAAAMPQIPTAVTPQVNVGQTPAPMPVTPQVNTPAALPIPTPAAAVPTPVAPQVNVRPQDPMQGNIGGFAAAR